MSIIRVQKKERWTTVSNVHINDDRLSWKATAILTYLLSKPNDWTVYVKQLANAKKDGIKAVYSGIRELKEFGYIEHKFIHDVDGKIKHGEYIVHEEPIPVEMPVNRVHEPYAQKGDTVKGKTEKGTLLNTNLKQELKDNNDGQETPPPPFSKAGFELVTALAGLISIVPEAFQTKAVEKVIETALDVHGVDYIKSAIQYSNDHSNGQTAAKYKAYLGKTIEGGWAYGYESASNKNKDVIANEFQKMDDNTLRAMAGAGNAWAVKELCRREK